MDRDGETIKQRAERERERESRGETGVAVSVGEPGRPIGQERSEVDAGDCWLINVCGTPSAEIPRGPSAVRSVRGRPGSPRLPMFSTRYFDSVSVLCRFIGDKGRRARPQLGGGAPMGFMMCVAAECHHYSTHPRRAAAPGS